MENSIILKISILVEKKVLLKLKQEIRRSDKNA
jgi:hypothetical protein